MVRVGPLAGAALLLALSLAGQALAGVVPGNEKVRITALMGGFNGDSRIQYVELQYGFGANLWSGNTMLEFHDGTGQSVGTFKFTSDPIEDVGLGYVLVATEQFVEEFGVTPDFMIPDGAIVGVDGMVCFRDDPTSMSAEFVHVCVSYGDFAGSTTAPDACRTLGPSPVAPRTGSADRGLPIAVDPNDHANFPSIRSTITNPQFSDFGCDTGETNSNGDFEVANHLPQNEAGMQVAAGDTVTTPSEEQGETLFNLETFDGNGRTCLTCHDPVDSFGLSPDTIMLKAATDQNCGPVGFISCDPLFVHLTQPFDLALLEDNCLMQAGDQRGLILENIDTFANDPVFRSTPHLVNIANTAPYGMGFCDDSMSGGPNCQTIPDLSQFCAGAIEQHFPKSFDPIDFTRNSDPSSGLPLDFRAPTDFELEAMEVFQDAIDFPERAIIESASGATVEERRDDIIDKLLDQAVSEGANRAEVDAGRVLFFGDGQCFRCHDGEALDRTLTDFTTGRLDHFDIGTGSDGGTDTVTNISENTDDGCEGSTFDPTLPLPAEAAGRREFNTFPLIGIARTPPFFHDGSKDTLFDVVAHYNGPNFDLSPSGAKLIADGTPISLNGPKIRDIAAFMDALTVVPEPSVVLLQLAGLVTLLGARRWRRH